MNRSLGRLDGSGAVTIKFDAPPANSHVVDDALKGAPESKTVPLSGEMQLRSLYADKLRFGQKLRITIEVDGE